MLDAPVGPESEKGGWLIDRLGRDFSLLTFGPDQVEPPGGVAGIALGGNGLAWRRYDARPGTTYLIRPDRYVAARWRSHDPASVAAAFARAQGRNMGRSNA